MLPGLRNADLEKCSHCMVGKQTRVSFKKHPHFRKFELLELVHSDVYGPLKVKSFSGALYFVTFIDDCSKKIWVYALKTKNQVLEKFKVFHVLVERQSEKKLNAFVLTMIVSIMDHLKSTTSNMVLLMRKFLLKLLNYMVWRRG